MQYETAPQKQARIDREALRILAWRVQRNRYSAEPIGIDGGRRGKARIATFTFGGSPPSCTSMRHTVPMMSPVLARA